MKNLVTLTAITAGVSSLATSAMAQGIGGGTVILPGVAGGLSIGALAAIFGIMAVIIAVAASNNDSSSTTNT